MEEVVTSRLFALVIGIDKYASSDIRPLRGAVADARKVQSYLLQLGVPGDNIKILLDESATRSAILGEFRRLSDDPSIRPGDPIFIFYAGHGSETASPSSWKAAGIDDKVQLLIPYDVCWKRGETAIAPIPDRTIAALLDAIVDRKGDNIVIAMDSCHSGSGTRDNQFETETEPEPEPVRSIRVHNGFQLDESQDQEIWSEKRPRYGLQSYILLSACGSAGKAFESEEGGDFTVALLEYLRGSPTNQLTYREIIMRLEIDASRQSPHCEGFNQERYIFTTTSAPSKECYHLVFSRTKPDGAFAFRMNGGAAHGLVAQDEFDIYADINSAEPVAKLVVEEVGSFYSTISCLHGYQLVPCHKVARRPREAKRLRVYACLGDKLAPDNALDILECILQDSPNYTRVETLDECDIEISVQNDHAIWHFKNKKEVFRTGTTAKELERPFTAPPQFFHDLDRTAIFTDITKNVKVILYEIDEPQMCLPGTSTADFFSKSVPQKNDSFALRQGSSYALKLENDSIYDLYPTVQHFHFNEFSVETWYQSPCSRFKVDVPLEKGGGFLAIGYGSGGSPPIAIPLLSREGHGCLKISLSTRPLDPLFDTNNFRVTNPLPEHLNGPWATITIPLTYWLPITKTPLLDFQRTSVDSTISQPPGLTPSIVKEPSIDRAVVKHNTQSRSIYILDYCPPPSDEESHARSTFIDEGRQTWAWEYLSWCSI